MNILVIGNGFDLEHNLPTSYSDFLDFCKNVRQLFEPDALMNKKRFQDDVLKAWKTDPYIKKVLLAAFDSRHATSSSIKDLEYDTGIRTGIKELDELYSYVKFNTWLEYFEGCRINLGKNWIDFESEISRVIRALDVARFQLSCGGSITNVEGDQNQKTLLAILKAAKGNLRDAYGNVAAISKFAKFLNKELDKLIRALELYLAYFVNKIVVDHVCTDIKDLELDAVLSFNYTDTFERVYGEGREVRYDFIHGKADVEKTVESCNIVLGIDEYLDDERKDVELDFLTFKKYYQRIFKSTGNKYLNWIDKIKSGYDEYQVLSRGIQEQKVKNSLDGRSHVPYQLRMQVLDQKIECPQHTVYIFGHSLDVTDRDILKLLICNENVQTKIYYYRNSEEDKKSLGKLIKNLVLIMGQEELIRRTGGMHKTIEFIPQSLHET